MKNKLVAVLVARNVHDTEAASPVAYLREHGAEVRYIGIQRGSVTGQNGSVITIDAPVQDVHAGEFDALVIPGGKAPELLRLDEGVLAFVREFMMQAKPIAAICHGPQVLISAKLVGGRKMTCYPGIRDDLLNAGAHYRDAEVVVDGNLITSRTPDDLPAFNKALGACLIDYDRVKSPWIHASPTRVLEYAIFLEIKAQALYETLAKQCREKHTKAKFKFLAETEKSHRDTLTELFVKLSPGRKPTPRDFGGASEGARDIDPSSGLMEILQGAMAGEESAYRMYTGIAEKVKNAETRKLFTMLAESELQHRQLLEQEVALLSERPLPSAIEKEPWWLEDQW
ncbi:MAG TPA: DJ-1/PfpI/YhbO family deglycase/protease [Candidatus Ozemobacteraceae bacterium]